jgi:hypothetical protein
VSSSRLSDEAWRVLDHRLPWSFRWLTWDHCYRLRIAVRDLFVERQIDPAVFSKIAADDRIFNDVAEAFSQNERGLRYLERVKQWMFDDGSFNHSARVGVINELLLGRFRPRNF